MHIILGLLGTLAAIIFAINRFNTNARALGKGAQDLADAAQTLSNLPRKMRYRKKAGKRDLDLVEGPVEAATVLMIAISRMDGTGKISDGQNANIVRQLTENMQLSPNDADDYILQLGSLTADLKQADSALFPMLDILRQSVNADEARQLSSMLVNVAETDSLPNTEQLNFIRRFEDRMGLGT